ncbi:hypothetical protein IQ265_12755 [Nodosilinea sp. LEGE 06152]|uniref:hypothetical protein n=1 Tax=Nodosilinea sp. LEGE 06152 TaxID=2777966 RepID=UPI0018830F44|nr:hypothetical protein [Nodosilinea sp. LEGE 06152]MBE9157689.1 hypothetical protein [Nodosilinea sp. LEGE 06152]
MAQILITINGYEHVIPLTEDGPDVSGYPPAGQATLLEEYAAGRWEPYTPPELAPEPISAALPDWPAFRLALLKSATFRAWSEALPATWREDLKLAAIAANEEALQGIYNLLVEQSSPDGTAAAEWQAIADANHIPLTF